MDESSRSAEVLFTEYLRLLEDGQQLDFEVWVAAHGSLEAELRELFERKKQASGRVAEEGAHAPPGQSLGGLAFILGTQGARVPFSIQAAASAGDVIGDFRLLHPIGSGGMGQVWEALQISLNRPVALKLIRPGCVRPQALEMFAREARAGGRLSHGGIVAVYGFGESRGVHWIAMELVPGGTTLRDFIDRMRPAAELPQGYDRQMAELVVQLADALAAAHAAHVIHRDIKPQNVLISAEGRPKLTDFGLARITDEEALTRTGEFAGTYLYMSPEQVAANRLGVDHRSDIFSLGVVLYELLGLVRPFQGDTAHQIAEKILTHDPQDLRSVRSRVPLDLAVITGKALEKRREARFQSMAEFAADLRRFLANEPIQAQPPTRSERLVKWARRNPTRSAAGGVAAVSFVAIALLLARNVRANRDLTRTAGQREDALGSLRTANEELAEQTEAARVAERAAEAAAAEAKERADEVLRLSALQEYEDLIAEADDLQRMWPPHPERIPTYLDWIEHARRLVDDLPLHRVTRDKLRAHALPRGEDERRRERAAHPRYRELVLLERRIAAQERALAQRRDGVGLELPDVSGEDFPDDASRSIALAAGLVDEKAEERGREPEALALARRGLELAGEADAALRSQAWSVLARAAFALGRDDEALAAADEALRLAEGERKEQAASELAALDDAVAAARSSAGLAAAERELAALEAERIALDARVDERVDWRFLGEQSQARWWNAQLTKLIDGLEALADESTGLLGAEALSLEHGWSVPLRLARARELAAGFLPGGVFDMRWRTALPAIRQAYAGLELPIQMGLVPIGPDPESGLWEFWVIQSGAEPERGADGRLTVHAEMGIALTLIPSGAFQMGAQRDPAGPNPDPDGQNHEGPVHEVSLSAYFLSKYELTQAQWRRLTGSNPSRFSPESEPDTVEWTHPVETVDWPTSRAVLRRLGLELPSEAQWERGARAGTTTPYSCPEAELATHANLADEAYARRFTARVTPEPWSDGYGVHSAVGSLAPNGFGLFDMHGNLWEWCLDGWDEGFYGRSPRHDPVVPWDGAARRMARGGCFLGIATRARSASRNVATPQSADGDLGVRAARALDIHAAGPDRPEGESER